MARVISAPLDPGVPTAMFAKLDASGRLAGRIALSELGDLIKKQARINAYVGHHQYGTPTPATPGYGPASISRTLINSIQRSDVTQEIFGWYCQVGTVGDRFPPYMAGPNASSKYGYILEVTGCKNGATYPFLYPAAKFGFDYGARLIFDRAYGTAWTTLFAHM